MPIDPVEPRTRCDGTSGRAHRPILAGRASRRSQLTGVRRAGRARTAGTAIVNSRPGPCTLGTARPGSVHDRSSVATRTGGPSLTQQRNLVTAIPGPRSLEQLARKKPHVADGVGTTLPVFVDAAGGGVLLDVDGNSLIDLGSGIAVTTVGNAAPEVVAPGAGAGRGVHPHLLHGHAVRRLRRRLRGARRAHAGRPREEVGAVQLRRRGGRERREDRPRRDRQGRASRSSTTPTTAAPT